MIQNYKIEELNKLELIDYYDLLENEFNNKNYEEIIEIKNYLMFYHKDYLDDLTIIYFVLLSLIALDKINEIKPLIDNTNIYSNNPDYLSEDEGSYLNILTETDNQKSLILLRYLYNTDILKKDKLIISLLSLLSNLYELGTDEQIINELNNEITQII